MLSPDGKKRCFGYKVGQELYAEYHDNEWGIPCYDDRMLFEMLILEGAQAGLNWETILKKRIGYRLVFHQFCPNAVAVMSDDVLEKLCADVRIIRNRLKIYSTRNNARVFCDIQKKYGSFSDYLWAYINHQPIINHWDNFLDVPVTTGMSDRISNDLKKRGMRFVGSTIIYAYMQAVGMVNDHIKDCWCYGQFN